MAEGLYCQAQEIQLYIKGNREPLKVVGENYKVCTLQILFATLLAAKSESPVITSAKNYTKINIKIRNKSVADSKP